MKRIINHLKENWIRHGFETLVVTIGILGAFTLNNWNERRKQLIILDIYLTSLQEAINDDIENLSSIEEVNLFRVRSINYLMLFTGNKTIIDSETGLTADPFSEKTLSISAIPKKYWNKLENTYDPKLIGLAFTWSSRPNLSQFNKQAFEEFKNTGMFSMIEDLELREAINDYYLDLEWVFSQSKEDGVTIEAREWLSYLQNEIGVLITDVNFMDEPLKLLENPKTSINLRNIGRSAYNRLVE